MPRAALSRKRKPEPEDAGDKMDWALLWQLLKPDSILLGLAVAAALAVAAINVQIPALLGEVGSARGDSDLALLLLCLVYCPWGSDRILPCDRSPGSDRAP